MIIVLLGESCSGKNKIEKELIDNYDLEKIVPYTTRKIRDGETNGEDYWFIDVKTFLNMIQDKLFVSFNKYSHDRYYGTAISDYYLKNKNDNDKVVVLTPEELRKLKNVYDNEQIFSVYITSNLGERVKRYVDRCGVDQFGYEDCSEIIERVNRDFGMFLGIENEVDSVVENSNDCYVNNIIKEIIDGKNKKKNQQKQSK